MSDFFFRPRGKFSYNLSMGTSSRMKLRAWSAVLLNGLLVVSCATLPEPKFKRFDFPEENAFVDTPPEGKRYQSLGVIRTRVDFSNMIQDKTEEQLCANYYNKAVRDLLYKAKKTLEAEALMNIRSVVFYMDGKRELHKDPQCAEDETGGQILLQAEALKWLPPPAPEVSPSPSPRKAVPVRSKKI